jgi:hypothetical protein
MSVKWRFSRNFIVKFVEKLFSKNQEGKYFPYVFQKKNKKR